MSQAALPFSVKAGQFRSTPPRQSLLSAKAGLKPPPASLESSPTPGLISSLDSATIQPVKQRLFVLTTVFILISNGIVGARMIRLWSYQELLDKSDLVVIATPTATNDTQEHIDLPGFHGQPVIGVETKFRVSAILKGDKTLKDFVLHHYRADNKTVDNGPNLISFDPEKKQQFLLFLVREADGRYAPAFGQMDPGLYGINAIGRFTE
ncbi:MAG: hypothetical protein HY343_03440 [Lentisphaerae bacterium]|nr:hypothetical protein [Lentisphaerota bacterium]